MNKQIAKLILTMIAVMPGFAQSGMVTTNNAVSDSIKKTKPFQATLIYPLGTDVKESATTNYNVSLNLLSGVTGDINGVEFSGIYNIKKGTIKGVQASGIFNMTEGTIRGLQASGIFNMTEGSIAGVQAGGIFNMTKGDIKGVQESGIFNITEGSITGVQAGGIFNITKGDIKGVQAGGVFNMTSGNTRGAQFAGVFNRTGTGETAIQAAGILNSAQGSPKVQVSGLVNHSQDGKTNVQIAGLLNCADTTSVQISGLVNKTHKGGFQLGIINIRDTDDGIMIGLINIAKENGLFEVEASGSEFLNTSISLRTGVDRLYSILSFGYNFSDKFFGYGAGLGTAIPLNEQWGINIEGTHTFLTNKNFDTKRYNALVQLKPLAYYTITSKFKVFAGPSLNFYIANNRNGANDLQISTPSTLFSRDGNTELKGWIGGTIGVRFSPF